MAADDRHREPRRKLRDPFDALVLGALVALVVVAPWMQRGWLLLLDWVPGPRAWRPNGGSTLPTGPAFAVPMSALHALFGAATSWLPIFVVLAVATAGAARLIDGPLPARVACGVAYGYNPFVFDRLTVGQISVLAGYAVLPWLLRVALRADSITGVLAAGALWALAASCTVHFAWIGGVLVLAVALARAAAQGGRRVFAGFGIALATCAVLVAPWVLLSGSQIESGDANVLRTFATLPDGKLGRSLGLLAEQGFWRPVVTRPAADLGAFFVLVAAATLAVAGLGLLAAIGTSRARAACSVTLAASAGWILAHGSAGPAGSLYRFAFDHVPGFGVMREAQKWDALVCLAVAFGMGAFAVFLASTRASKAAWLVVVLPIALAPTLAWGLSGRVEPSRYPSSWSAVRTSFDAMPGEVVALPWTQYLLPGVTGNRTVADPLGSYFGHRVLSSRNAGVPGLSDDRGRRAAIGAAVERARADAAAGRPMHLGADLRALDVAGVLALDAGLPLDRDPGLRRRAGGAGIGLYAVV